MQVQRYLDPPRSGEFTTAPSTDLVLVLVTHGHYGIESRRNGHWTGTGYHPGSIGATPPGRANELRWSSQSPERLVSVHLRLGGPLVDETLRSMKAPVTAELPDCLQLSDPFVSAAAHALDHALRVGAPGAYGDSVAQALVAHLCHQTMRKRASPSPGLDRRTVERVEDYMRDHLADDVGLDDLARVATMSKYHFVRLFREATGRTPYQRLIDLRIETASSLLDRPGLTVGDVARACGYRSPDRFSAVFRDRTGVTPREHRAQRRP